MFLFPMQKMLYKSFILLMITLNTIACDKSHKPMIIGHRGAKGHIAENTLPSISKALELGVDGIEIDVFLCRSGELVVFHDKTLERLTDGQGYIETLELDSIKKLKVKGQYKIPTLAEVLDLVNGKVLLNIELKGSGTARPTHEILIQYTAQNKGIKIPYIISSFNWEELRIFYELNKNIPIAVLTDADPLDALPTAHAVAAEAINPNFKALNKKNVRKIHDAGYKIYPYTINETADIQKMLQLKVDAIITDFPDRVTSVISAR